MNRSVAFGFGRAAATAVIVTVLDQATKWAVFHFVNAGDEVNVFIGVSFSQTRNEGIAFGLFSGRPWLVLGLVAAALSVLVWFFARHRDRPGLWLATGLLLGGAFGNAIDRLTIGYVRDFVNLPGWPSFNVADIAITCGVIVLVLTAEHKHSEDVAKAEFPGDGDDQAH
ncbi:MAG: signal peptidase II [Actinobacteria bacterium]|nr:signal peptidase II [Actinomycetota bacterium]